MNVPKNEIRNLTLENLPQGESADYDEYQDFRGMNRFMLILIAAAIIPWFFGSYAILGFNINGWCWVIPLVISGLICLKNISRITFPIVVWLAWIIFLSIYWFFGRHNPYANQNFAQMISPFVIGCAASIFRSDNWQLENIIHWISKGAIIAWVILIIRLPMILIGSLPGHGFMAAEMIGLLLLGACYASFYACGSHRHLYFYLSMIAITFVALVRGPIVAMLSCMPLTVAPFKLSKRIAIFILVVISAIVIFNTERVQQRMFTSGSGSMSDVRWDNPDFKKSGRTTFADILWPGFNANPIFGNGFNAYRSIFSEAGLEKALPHNDWLKLLHDTGIVGACLYLFTMLLQIFFLVQIARWSTGAHRMLAYGAATAFIPYMLIMFTDNVILYVQFFGNLHFALIGIVYGAVNRDEGYSNA